MWKPNNRTHPTLHLSDAPAFCSFRICLLSATSQSSVPSVCHAGTKGQGADVLIGLFLYTVANRALTKTCVIQHCWMCWMRNQVVSLVRGGNINAAFFVYLKGQVAVPIHRLQDLPIKKDNAYFPHSTTPSQRTLCLHCLQVVAQP